MNGPIAQLVALTCHSNAFLRGLEKLQRFFPDNSTCNFCDRISFVGSRTALHGDGHDELIAATPDDWFTHLREQHALGVRLIHQSQNHPQISDRMSVAFVGGGGEWLLAARYPESTEYWVARWEVWNRNAPEQRIWRVAYQLAARRLDAPPASPVASDVAVQLRSALVQIHAFAQAHDCGEFTNCFSRALESLDHPANRHGYHKDLCATGTISASSAALLDAAQSAWVFGGMGSWNDLVFDGADGAEYDRVSERLFGMINEAICAAANESESVTGT